MKRWIAATATLITLGSLLVSQDCGAGALPRAAGQLPPPGTAGQLLQVSARLWTPAMFRRLLAREGSATPRAFIISYSGVSGLAARLWVVSDTFGLGGRSFIVRQDSGRAPALDLFHSLAGVASLPCGSRLASVAYVVHHLLSPGTLLIDARAPPLYQGAAVEVPGERAGHIPGAVNLPYTRLLAGARLRPLPELARAFAGAGAKPGVSLVVYCHSGHKASIVYLAARMLSYRVRIFLGSWQQWSRNPKLPVALGTPADRP